MLDRSKARLTVGFFLLALLGGDEFTDGLKAYREGRYGDAVKAYRAAEAAEGEDTSPDVLFNLALSLLRAGDVDAAEAAIERGTSRADRELSPSFEFLRGHVRFARVRLAEQEAGMTDAGPFGWDAAIEHARAAADAWKRAAMTREDWPEARRNVERTLELLDHLHEQQQEAREKAKKAGGEERVIPVPVGGEEEGEGEEGDSAGEEQATPSEGLPAALSPAELRSLLERLGEKEREKTDMRRDRRRRRSADVERDW